MSSDFTLYAHKRICILHFIESKHKSQNISKIFSSSFEENKSYFWHNSGVVATSIKDIKILLRRYTAGFIIDDNSR